MLDIAYLEKLIAHGAAETKLKKCGVQKLYLLYHVSLIQYFKRVRKLCYIFIAIFRRILQLIMVICRGSTKEIKMRANKVLLCYISPGLQIAFLHATMSHYGLNKT